LGFISENCYNAIIQFASAPGVAVRWLVRSLWKFLFLLGYMVQRKTIAGSCGGLAALGIEKACDCDKPCEKRQERMRKEKEWQDNKII